MINKLPAFSVLFFTFLLVMSSSNGLGAVTGDGTSTTGGDAGDTLLEAASLPGSGSYDGLLDSADDVDWYEAPAGSGMRCVSLDATPDHQALASLRIGGAGIDMSVAGGTTATGTLAVKDVASIYSGFDNEYENLLEGSDNPYLFTLEDVASDELGAGDGGTGTDAGSDPATALSFTGACVRGQLGKGDVRDSYAMSGSQGDQVVFSIVSTGNRDVNFTLVDPAGAVALTGATGDTVGTTLTSTGTWTIELSAVNDGQLLDYMVGQCRPHCLEA